MWLLMVIAGFLSIFVLTSVFSDYSNKQIDSSATQMASAPTSPTLGNYNAFAYGAVLYMRDSDSVPLAGIPIYWSAIKSGVESKGFASPFLQADIPANWKIVPNGQKLFSDGDQRGFYLCADMPDAAVAVLARKVPPELALKMNNLEKTSGSETMQLAVFDSKFATPAEVDTGATECLKN
ncbi:MAG: hypothetical protein H6R18_81 [Proteobacteria bacterium]|nr:hypothetical protein [Pseudomonadota bacterium]